MHHVAVLAWDSPALAEGALPTVWEDWRRDGPRLPLDITHVTKDLGLLAVICRGAPEFPVMWNLLETSSAAEALWALAKIYGARPEDIGYVDLESGMSWCRTVDEKVPEIRHWAESRRLGQTALSMVIWNDLRPNFQRKTGREPTKENVLSFVKRLPEDRRSRLIIYLRNMPEGIDPPIRRYLLVNIGT